MNTELFTFGDPGEMARRAAEVIVAAAPPGSWRIALSGGTTPRPLYSLLAQEPYRSAMDWSRVDLFWVDERAVPPDHPDSNFRAARELLIDPLGLPQDRIHRMPADCPDLDAAARAYESELARAFETSPPSFDLVVLGIGADGHIASLFPGSETLNETRRGVVAAEAPVEPRGRLTLTPPVLRRAVRILVLVSGAAKAEALARALEGPFEPDRCPAQILREAQGRVIWMADAAAASRVRGNEPPKR
ncbi:MAG: 6-phosphogluconolactonase [Planctomycetes bacterium]|nr:6-phosphogluconolactonase [Planctomycetota bacterium]